MSEEEQGPPDISEEELVELLDRYRTDFEFAAPRLLKVLNMKGKIVSFVLNGPQRVLNKIIEDIATRRLVRLILLKARRVGWSTLISARNFHKTSWNFNRLASQVTHEPDATEVLFGMVKRFYDFTPEWLRPSTRYNNARLLDFNTKDGKGLGSGFRVATAAKEDFGSGQLIHYFHGSEVSKWPEETVKDLITSVLQCVPDDPDTEVIFESTAKGIGGEYFDRFWGARFRVKVVKMNPPSLDHLYGYDAAGKYDVSRAAEEIEAAAELEEAINEHAKAENIYTAIFVPWFCFEEYQTKPYPTFANDLTDEEKEIQKTYGLTLAQLYWRRLTIANKCNGSIDIFNQEYPDCPEHAFLAAGRPVFDNAKLMRLRNAVPKPVARYELAQSINQFISNPKGALLVWEEPKAGQNYIISADVAEGLEHGDFSSADVINHATGIQVAQWHGHTDPDLFAYVLAALGKRYNTALLAPERNNHGLTVVKWLHEIIQYPNLYVEMVPDPPGKPRKRYGWLTSSATKPMIIDVLVREVRDDCHGIACAATFDEMMAFKVQGNGKTEADRGRFDDRVISLAIGKYLRTAIPLPEAAIPDHIKQREERTERKRSPLGWT
ncbi:MAG TPA: hypothetical protein DCS05_09000 [Nitrospiraceae bacterium]|nr:hypothetical protein [Nitrospiraceae bacterium]